MAADTKSAEVLTAKKERPEGDLYVSLLAVEWGKDDQTYKAKHGAYFAMDIIEVKPMAQNMVTIKADGKILCLLRQDSLVRHSF